MCSSDLAAPAIIAFGNIAFKGAVIERVIFHLHGKRFSRWVEARTFGNGPTHQNAVHLQAEVIMQPGSVMPLHAKKSASSRFFRNRLFRGRFRRPLEVPFPGVFFEAHYHLDLTAARGFATLEYASRLI